MRKVQILSMLDEGPCTAREIAESIYGRTDKRTVLTVSSQLCQFAKLGIVRNSGRWLVNGRGRAALWGAA